MVQKRQGLSAQQPSPAQVLGNLQTQQATPNVQVNIPRPQLLTVPDLSKLSKTLEQALKLEVEEDLKIEAAQGAEYARTLDPEQRANIGLINQAKAVEQGLLPAERTETFWNALQGTAAELNVVDRFLPALNKREQELISAEPEERTRLFQELWAETVGGGTSANYYYSQASAGLYSEIASRKLSEYDKKHNDQAVAQAKQDAIHLGAEVIDKRVSPILNSGRDLTPEWQTIAEKVNESWKGTLLGQDSQQNAVLTMLLSLTANYTRTDQSIEDQRRGAEKAIALLQAAEDEALIGSGQPGGPGYRQAFPEGSDEHRTLTEEISKLIAKERRISSQILTDENENKVLVSRLVQDRQFSAGLLDIYKTRGFESFDDLLKDLRQAGATMDNEQLRTSLDEVFDKYGLPRLDDADFRTITATDTMVSVFVDEIDRVTKLSYGDQATEEDRAALIAVNEALRQGKLSIASGLVDTIGNATIRAEAEAAFSRARQGELVREQPGVKSWWDSTRKVSEAFAAEVGNKVRSEYFLQANAILDEAEGQFRQLWEGKENLTPEAVRADPEWKALKEQTAKELADLESAYRAKRAEVSSEVSAKVSNSLLFAGEGGQTYTEEDLIADLVTTGYYNENSDYIRGLRDTLRNGTASRITYAGTEATVHSIFEQQIASSVKADMFEQPTEEQLARGRDVLSKALKEDMKAYALEKAPDVDPDQFYKSGDNRRAYTQEFQRRLTRNRSFVNAIEAVQAPQPQEGQDKGTEEALAEIGGQGTVTNDALSLAAHVQQSWSAELKKAGGTWFSTEDTRDLFLAGNGPNGKEAKNAWAGMDAIGTTDGYDQLRFQIDRLAKGDPLKQSFLPYASMRGTATRPGFIVPTTPRANPAELAAELSGAREDEFGELVLPTPFDPFKDLGTGYLLTSELPIRGSGAGESPGLARDLELKDEITTEFYFIGDGQEMTLDEALQANFNGLPAPPQSPWVYSDFKVVEGLVDHYFDDDDFTADAARRGLLTGVAYYTSGGISPESVISGSARISLGTQAEVIIDARELGKQAVTDKLTSLTSAFYRDFEGVSPTTGLNARRVLRSRHVDVDVGKAMPEYDPAKVRIGDPEFVLRFFAEHTGPDGRFLPGSEGEKWLQASNKLGRKQSPIPNTAESVQALLVAQMALSVPWTEDKDWTNKIQVERDRLRELQRRGRSAVK